MMIQFHNAKTGIRIGMIFPPITPKKNKSAILSKMEPKLDSTFNFLARNPSIASVKPQHPYTMKNGTENGSRKIIANAPRILIEVIMLGMNFLNLSIATNCSTLRRKNHKPK